MSSVSWKLIFACGVVIIVVFMGSHRRSNSDLQYSEPTESNLVAHNAEPVPRQPPGHSASKVEGPGKARMRVAEIPAKEIDEFRSNFDSKYKPVIVKWCAAYEGHLSFSADAVTAEKLVERIGLNQSYHEYVFVIDGITLGVREADGLVQVDYLNSPGATAKLNAIPANSVSPGIQSPVSRDRITGMLKADTGIDWKAGEVQMIATGISSALKGGVNVIVGGDINDFVSWKYNLVFGSDGILVYYLKGKK